MLRCPPARGPQPVRITLCQSASLIAKSSCQMPPLGNLEQSTTGVALATTNPCSVPVPGNLHPVVQSWCRCQLIHFACLRSGQHQPCVNLSISRPPPRSPDSHRAADQAGTDISLSFQWSPCPGCGTHRSRVSSAPVPQSNTDPNGWGLDVGLLPDIHAGPGPFMRLDSHTGSCFRKADQSSLAARPRYTQHCSQIHPYNHH